MPGGDEDAGFDRDDVAVRQHLAADTLFAPTPGNGPHQPGEARSVWAEDAHSPGCYKASEWPRSI